MKTEEFTCRICEDQVYDKDLPTQWGTMIIENEVIYICEECRKKWLKKFGYEFKAYRIGGEELKL